MKPFESLTPGAKVAWLFVPIMGAFAFASYKVEHEFALRYPTTPEEHKLDGILRPAAVNAARVALSLYYENQQLGFIGNPVDIVKPPKKATELFIRLEKNGVKYSVTVDMSRRLKNGHPDPKSVYDMTIFKGEEKDALYITADDYESNSIRKDFLFAGDHGGTVNVDLQGEVTNSDVKEAMQDAPKIAAEARADIAVLAGRNF